MKTIVIALAVSFYMSCAAVELKDDDIKDFCRREEATFARLIPDYESQIKANDDAIVIAKRAGKKDIAAQCIENQNKCKRILNMLKRGENPFLESPMNLSELHTGYIGTLMPTDTAKFEVSRVYSDKLCVVVWRYANGRLQDGQYFFIRNIDVKDRVDGQPFNPGRDLYVVTGTEKDGANTHFALEKLDAASVLLLREAQIKRLQSK